MQPSYKDPWPVSKRFREMMDKGEMRGAQLVFFSDNKPAEELYDLENDPHEINNLAENPEYSDQLERHRNILAGWIEDTGDRGQLPESEIGLRRVFESWGDKCVNPEYEIFKEK